MMKLTKLASIFIALVLTLSSVPLNAGAESTVGSRIRESIILYVGSPVAYVNGEEKRIDPDNLEVVPVILKNAEMVPVRFIAESLGGNASWDQAGKTAIILLNGKQYRFVQGSAQMTANGKTYSLGAPVQAYKGRTFVPLDRFVEIVGKKAVYERGLIVISNTRIAFDKGKDKAIIDEWISKLSFLPVVGSRDKLLNLMKEVEKTMSFRYGGVVKKSMALPMLGAVQNATMAVDQAAAADNSVSKSAQTGAAAGGDYSATNVQVQGVDEGDIVKTDGNYIYQVNKQRIVVVKATPPEGMKVVSILDYTDKNVIPQEIYLEGQKLVVIGMSHAYFPLYKEAGGVKKEIYPSRQFSRGSTKALIYDMTDRSKIKLLREVELQGSYVSSRKIGSALYLVANDSIDYYSIQNGDANATPTYRDTRMNVGMVNIDYKSIRYFPGTVEPSYMIVAGIDINGNDAANVTAYLGAGHNIYASSDNLYVAVMNYSNPMAKSNYEESTQIYKFAMKDSKVTYLCKGSVPGAILNQFSMDENKDTFRLATTKGNAWSNGEGTSKNALYALDSMLTITGKIEDMAPGEKIYSVRFMGDRAYVVTFRTVDPLFVIDLKDPTKPSILGALKIPGYSDYLHPYDENHIIGFGKDTVEVKGQAYYQGLKLALFDVTDVGRPVQMYAEMIGDRGTDSDLLRNHKALLFSKEKNLLAFPVTLMEKRAGSSVRNESLDYGQFTFQGAYVYSLDLKSGFTQKGRITHLSDQDYLKSGNNWYDSDKNVQRILYIGSNLYTLSNGMIKANAISDLKETGKVTIP